MNNSKLYQIVSGLDKMRWSVAIKGIIAGAVAGLLAVLYRVGIDFGVDISKQIYAYLRVHPLMIFLWLIIIIVVGSILTWFVKLEPMATGSGIPQVEGMLLYGMKMRWALIIPVRYAAGFLSAFFGVSLGREGPSIQLGASGAQGIAKAVGKNKLEANYIITGGAAAGLSAAFSAPLSGMIFALEEVHRSFSPNILIVATTASLTADAISQYFFGLKPELNFLKIHQLPEHLYPWLLLVGLVSGLAGTCMNKALLLFQTLYTKAPIYLRSIVALVIALIVGLTLPDLLGGGQNLIQMAEKEQIAIGMLLVFAVGKLLFTCTSFGSGIPGGIFMPILSVGALSGGAMAVLAVHFGMPTMYIPNFCVCAMAGALSSSVKAPITSIMLTAEMTGTLVHMLPVALCAFIALLVSDFLKAEPVYEALLERIMDKGNDTKEEVKAKKTGAILEIPVELGSEVVDKKIKDITWPKGSLVVGIHRGQKEFVPNGNTRIVSGDYLVVLSSENEYREMSVTLESMCRCQVKNDM